MGKNVNQIHQDIEDDITSVAIQYENKTRFAKKSKKKRELKKQENLHNSFNLVRGETADEEVEFADEYGTEYDGYEAQFQEEVKKIGRECQKLAREAIMMESGSEKEAALVMYQAMADTFEVMHDRKEEYIEALKKQQDERMETSNYLKSDFMDYIIKCSEIKMQDEAEAEEAERWARELMTAKAQNIGYTHPDSEFSFHLWNQVLTDAKKSISLAEKQLRALKLLSEASNYSLEDEAKHNLNVAKRENELDSEKYALKLNEQLYKKRAGQLVEALTQVGAIAATPASMHKLENYLRGNF